MNTTFTTTTINAFLDTFAGREGYPGYNDTKQVRIAECNRDFVWDVEMQKEFIKSIWEGYPIPAMCIANGKIVDGGNRSTTLWLYRNGKFKVKPVDYPVEINYEKMCEDRTLTRRWDSVVIPQQVITNATDDQFSQIYENLNKGVRLTTGQLLENRKYCPWVAMAESMIGRGDLNLYADRDLLRRVWRTGFKKTPSRTELADAFQTLVGAELGAGYFHKSFPQHIRLIMSGREPTTENLRIILNMLDSCDPERKIAAKTKRAFFDKFIGAIIYDFHSMERDDWEEKWVEFAIEAYNNIGPSHYKLLTEVGTKRALNYTRIQAISENVEDYMSGDMDHNHEEAQVPMSLLRRLAHNYRQGQSDGSSSESEDEED